jgi:hypothetical protein
MMLDANKLDGTAGHVAGGKFQDCLIVYNLNIID